MLEDVLWGSTMLLMPAFSRHPDEAASIGRLLAGYGEVEYGLAVCLGLTLDDHIQGLRTYFRQRSESSRLDNVDALMRPRFNDYGLLPLWAETLGAVRHCLRIRNKFSHCHWSDDERHPGLFFTSLQDAADAADDFRERYLHVDVTLLTIMEEYFCYTLEIVDFLTHEYGLKAGYAKGHPFPRPRALRQPPLHNPPEDHIPPWLT